MDTIIFIPLEGLGSSGARIGPMGASLVPPLFLTLLVLLLLINKYEDFGVFDVLLFIVLVALLLGCCRDSLSATLLCLCVIVSITN